MKTYEDIYKFPLVDYGFIKVFDSDSQPVFDHLLTDVNQRTKIIKVINSEMNFNNPNLSFYHKDGMIIAREGEKEQPIILIRGWGNLTGIGAHNLISKEAANVQKTFAEFIVNRLNFRDGV